MKINWKVRFKNPVFIAQLILAILAPILGYMGISYSDLTTWHGLFDVIFDAVKNPYVLSLVAVSLYNAIVDPTTAGHADSERAQTYIKPRKDGDK